MTPEQIAMVEASLDDLRPSMDEVAEVFYERLFAADPDVAALFTGNPDQQRTRFVAELEAICRTLRRLPSFLAAAHELGSRHRDYGVRAAHYRIAGPLLLAALAACSGDGWTSELEEAWRLAYHLTAETMMAGAASRPLLTPMPPIE